MNSLEAVHPLLALGALATDIKHVIVELSQLKQSLRDAGGAKARTKNVLVIGNVVFGEQTVDVGIVTSRRQLIGPRQDGEQLTIGCCRGEHTRCHVG